ncbi:MAG: DUF929 family protein [Candidatus Dormiibacterota bacterium]
MSKKSMAARRQMREATVSGRAGGARQASRGRTHRRNDRSAGRPWGLISGVIGVVVAFVIVVIVVATLPGALNQDVAVTPAPASLMRSITSVPSSTLKAVKAGDISNSPLNIPASYKPVALSSNGLPEIAFVGAEYCPYCALQRWSLIIGLSPFGTWSNLHLVRSSVYDSPPNLPTFTFAYGAKFTSKYVAFSSRELQSNVSINKNGSPYKSLQTVSGPVATAFSTIDSSQGYPFLDYAGKYVQLGSEALSTDVAAMSGLSWNQVAQQLRNPKSVVAKEVLGGASYVTAATCLITGQKPGGVCGQSYIKTLEQQLEKSS